MINDTQSPLVSCIMLSYKRFDLIYGAIDSVLSQDYPNIELILSDDGSENFPGKELEAYVQSHKRDNIVSVLIRRNETNLGTVRNQNAALSLASGKYVINLPNDDLFYNEHVISALVKEFEATGAQIISCRREYIDRETGKRLMILPDKRLERFIKKATPRQMYNRQAILSVFISGTYLTRETLLKYSAKSGTYRYMEDYPMFLSCSRNGVKIHK